MLIHVSTTPLYGRVNIERLRQEYCAWEWKAVRYEGDWVYVGTLANVTFPKVAEVHRKYRGHTPGEEEGHKDMVISMSERWEITICRVS